MTPPLQTPMFTGTGQLSREWVQFFLRLGNASGSGVDAITVITGDVTGTGPGDANVTIAPGVVTNAKLAAMMPATLKGRALGAVLGPPQDLTSAQATAILDEFTDTLQGVVPASGGGTVNFLRADATWAEPPGGSGGGWVPAVDGSEPPVFITDGAGVLLLVAGP